MSKGRFPGRGARVRSPACRRRGTRAESKAEALLHVRGGRLLRPNGYEAFLAFFCIA